MPRISIGKISEQIAKLAGSARRRERPTAVIEELGTQLRSLFRKRKAALIRRNPTLATVHVASAAVPANHAIAAHLATLVQRRLNRLVETRHFEAAKNPVDAVHDLRVASRRLRAFVDVFDPILGPQSSDARRSLRSITRAARPVRDLHVQLNDLRGFYTRTTSDIERIVIEELIARTEHRAKRQEQRLRKRLKRLDWKKINGALSTVVGETITHLPSSEQAVSNLAWQLIEPLTSLPTACIQPGNGEERPEELHELRITVKKLRYALEIFEPVFGPAFESIYEPVELLQESLGHHHDLYVLEGHIKDQRLDLERGQRTTMARAMRVFEQKLSAQRRALYEDLLTLRFDIVSWQQTVRGRLQQRSVA